MLKLLNLRTWKWFSFVCKIEIKQNGRDNLYIPELIYLPYTSIM